MIHQYKNNGYNIVMDVNSGAIHVVDELVYELIPRVGAILGQGITEDAKIRERMIRDAADFAEWPGEYDVSERTVHSALSEILELYRGGMLFSGDGYENYINEIKQRKTVVKALCLHVAHDCNLACRYCFAQEGEYAGDRGLMSLETGKKALDFLVNNSGNRVNLEVDFFGGEPLLNWDVVKEVVRYGRSLETVYHKKFRFTLTTNGILLEDEMLPFINAEMSNVVLSIDGRREINDRMRPYRGGQSSYDRIVPLFQKVAVSRNQTDYYVRGTFTRHNLDFSRDVFHLADLGFRQISVEPVVAGQDEGDYALRSADIPVILEEYDRLAQELLRRNRAGAGIHFFHFMMDLSGGPCVAKRLSGCGTGTEYLAVTPWGDLYPCHQFVGQKQFLLGNVVEGILRADIQDDFKASHVYAKEKCRKCFARFYCSGGCAANSWHFHGTVHDVYDLGCELQRKRVECAVMMQAAMAEYNL